VTLHGRNDWQPSKTIGNHQRRLATIKDECLNVGEMRVGLKCHIFQRLTVTQRTAFQPQNTSRDANCTDVIALKSADIDSLNGKGLSFVQNSVAQ
jgi:hypothetical protein